MIVILRIYRILSTNTIKRNINIKMAYRKIPDRWEDYVPLGKPVAGTRFIAFKVPLKEALCHSLPEDQRFTPSDLLQESKNSGINLGLVIDLTNTQRYYNPEIFLDAGVEYKKIFTVGKVVPSENVKMDFLSTVDDFIERNTDKDVLVGVHCTHGLNRTGHLVCRYMIDRLNMEPDEAIQLYNEARGHEMERENYIEDLRTCPTDMVKYDVFKTRKVTALSEDMASTNTNHNNALSKQHSSEMNSQYNVNHKRHFQNGQSLSNDEHEESLGHVLNHQRGRDGFGRGLSRDRHMQDRKGPGSGWSLPSDGHQRGSSMSRGPGSGWSLPGDRHQRGRGFSNDGQHHQKGPGSGWSLESDECRSSTQDFSGGHRERNTRGRGSGWSLPDDRQFRYEQYSRQYFDRGSSRYHRGYNEGQGHSRGRFQGQRGGYDSHNESSARKVYSSRYSVDNRPRGKPYDGQKHQSGSDRYEED